MACKDRARPESSFVRGSAPGQGLCAARRRVPEAVASHTAAWLASTSSMFWDSTGSQFSIQGHLDVSDGICRPYKIISLDVGLL